MHKLTPFYYLKKAASAKNLSDFSEAMINSCRIAHIQSIFAAEKVASVFFKKGSK